MKKSLYERAKTIRNGVLESRLVAREETLGREPTDKETIEELEYLRDTFAYSGYEEEYIKEVLQAVKYLLNRYS